MGDPSAPSQSVAASSKPGGLTIEVDGLTKRYGDQLVLDDLSFTARPGRITGFLGPNGSGKSTTMKILLGLASADGGTATIGGRPYREMDAPSRTVGAMVESNAFHPGRTGRNHLRIVADADGVELRRVDEVLDLVGLSGAADRRVGGYSLGMRQRLGLATALLGEPSVLVLDEPANGLDPKGIHEMRDLLRGRAAEGHTILVSSHLLGEVERLVDDLVVMNRGRLATSGHIDQLQDRTTRVRTPDPTTLTPLLDAAGGSVEQVDDVLVVRGLETDRIGLLAFEAGICLLELSPQLGSLEEQFLRWTADERA